RIDSMLPAAPSAICTSDVASLMLRWATFMERISERNLLAMARPAASSLARLIRKPLERRSIAPESFLPVVVRFWCAWRPLILVWTRNDMIQRGEGEEGTSGRSCENCGATLIVKRLA